MARRRKQMTASVSEVLGGYWEKYEKDSKEKCLAKNRPFKEIEETLAEKEQIIKNILTPLFAGEPDFMRVECMQAVRMIRALPSRRGDRLLGSTMHSYYRVLAAAFCWAEDSGLGKNRSLLMERRCDFPEDEIKKRPKPQLNDARKIMKTFRGTKYGRVAFFATGLGIGPEESAVIPWKNIRPDEKEPGSWDVIVDRKYSSSSKSPVGNRKGRTVVISGGTLKKVLAMKKKDTGSDGVLRTKGPCIPAGKEHGPVCFSSAFMAKHGLPGLSLNATAGMMTYSVFKNKVDCRGKRKARRVYTEERSSEHFILVRKPGRGPALNKPKAPKNEDASPLPPADAAPEKPDKAPEKEPDGQPAPEIQ